MNAIRLAAVSAAVSLSCAALAAGPLDQLRGKMKEGLYEYKMTMDIPGMPAGMQKAPHTFQHCVTQKDIEEGGFGKGGQQRTPENCEIKDFKMSGNTATYVMECKGENAMRADNKITFAEGSFVMDMKMQMTRQGQAMNMAQHMEGRHIGACTK
jgi:hypothetical protein